MDSTHSQLAHAQNYSIEGAVSTKVDNRARAEVKVGGNLPATSRRPLRGTCKVRTPSPYPRRRADGRQHHLRDLAQMIQHYFVDPEPARLRNHPRGVHTVDTLAPARPSLEAH